MDVDFVRLLRVLDELLESLVFVRRKGPHDRQASTSYGDPGLRSCPECGSNVRLWQDVSDGGAKGGDVGTCFVCKFFFGEISKADDTDNAKSMRFL